MDNLQDSGNKNVLSDSIEEYSPLDEKKSQGNERHTKSTLLINMPLEWEKAGDLGQDIHERFLNSDEFDLYDDFDIEQEHKSVATTESFKQRMTKLRERNWFARNFRLVSDGGIRSSAFT